MHAKKIIGKNIYLSPISENDREYYYLWMNDPSITDNIGRSDAITTEQSNKKWFEEAMQAKKIVFTIISNDKPIGCCGINDINYTHRTCEIYIYIGDLSERGKGYGKEAIRLLMQFIFGSLNMNSIMLRVFSFNKRAISLYRKVGFREIGRRRSGYYLGGKYYDIVFMDLLKTEYSED